MRIGSSLKKCKVQNLRGVAWMGHHSWTRKLRLEVETQRNTGKLLLFTSLLACERGSSIFLGKLIIYIHYDLRVLQFPIPCMYRGVMSIMYLQIK